MSVRKDVPRTVFVGSGQLVRLLVLFICLAGAMSVAPAREAAPAARAVFPKTILETRILDAAPDWVVKQGNIEFQHYALPTPRPGISDMYGKLFIDGKEVVSDKKTSDFFVLECAMANFLWTGNVNDPEVVETMSGGGWFPQGATPPRSGGAPTDVDMDVSDLVNRPADVREKGSDNDLWLFWNLDQDHKSAGGYGAMRIGGKWTVGEKPGQRVTFLGKEFVWHRPYDHKTKSAISGWLPADSGALGLQIPNQQRQNLCDTSIK